MPQIPLYWLVIVTTALDDGGWGGDFERGSCRKTHFFAKIQKGWIIIAPEKTEITIGDYNIFLHLCTAEKKKNLIFVQGAESYNLQAIFIFKLYTFCIIFSFFYRFQGVN